ncbi:fatty-acid amide hydrolase 1-like [Pomacea canaliculata]|uniref:fatty-acid amide hydrolase 1-like n=1 Tax=Pomacea canaliculata TaxID=400727 RepID=UPI000D736B04|nr:fatty-acid amide hydrolase 1-like [Pomacea canaliculata]XP_025110841.1 fatty-acid amide hydrolase 1-like [Pomacea canaliculata]XP_025110842.1 fatty-acid amide hydrolase 1-like [Pomacea canaliculata]XP_025110843.1 fatty-acid amide hydrolase 1-like [Pomacea canaliculata]
MKLNCVTEPIQEAEEQAQQLDLLPPEKRGPLHGIPVSIKESISLKGYDCTGGLQALAFQKMERDAEIVQVLKNLGAVPFMRTNFPQGLMTFACSNPIYGQTLHPLDSKRGPGGSSGGEGALIGGGGSIIGIGSDIGGSIRIPSCVCGVYGLKPTAGRIGSKGHYAVGSGQTLVKLSVGPMARDMGGLVLATKAVLSQEHCKLSPLLPPVPFRNEIFEKKNPMRIGFYTKIDGLQSHPGGVRALYQAKAALESRGHTVIEFQPPLNLSAFFELYVSAVFGDDGKEVRKYLDKDVVDRCNH